MEPDRGGPGVPYAWPVIREGGGGRGRCPKVVCGHIPRQRRARGRRKAQLCWECDAPMKGSTGQTPAQFSPTVLHLSLSSPGQDPIRVTGQEIYF
ncbi:hypothetical protein ANANG_G00084380 [Anguilla anguilla]|uniref:Uncharacterized protein n=1 Tax=Anguilla anguilla TaxID=7936 RepID=A0A9D3S0Z4_ANGAN|nr:hypothetical protein ANANG_G00084380 [Anguilla anguilla]